MLMACEGPRSSEKDNASIEHNDTIYVPDTVEIANINDWALDDMKPSPEKDSVDKKGWRWYTSKRVLVFPSRCNGCVRQKELELVGIPMSWQIGKIRVDAGHQNGILEECPIPHNGSGWCQPPGWCWVKRDRIDTYKEGSRKYQRIRLWFENQNERTFVHFQVRFQYR